MEAVAADGVFLVQRVRDSVSVCVIGHCLMECRVENGYLRRVGHQLLDCVDTFQVGWIVQGSQFNTFVEYLNHFIGDEHARVESFAAMHHTVSHRLYFVERFDAAVFLTQHYTQYIFNAGTVLKDFAFLKSMRLVPVKEPFSEETQAKIKALLPKTELTFK